MRTLKSVCRCFTALFVLSFALHADSQMASQSMDRAQGPIAISFLPSGKLVVLGGRGRLSVIDAGNRSAEPVKSSLGYFIPADMTAAHIADNDAVFVALYNAAERQGVLAQYSLSGEQIRTWTPRATIAGLAIDASQQKLYLGDPVTGEISTLALSGKSETPSYLLEVPGIARLGPLAVDTIGQQLFAADVGAGSIYRIDLRTHKSVLMASGMAEPAALTYDEAQKVLYIADAGARKIWRIDTSSTKPRATIFSAAPELREPRGIAVDSQHTVWIADHGAIAVFKLAEQGTVSMKISP